MNRIFNFSAGPSVLPEPALRRAQEEMMDYAGSGMSVMEMSHRSRVYEGIMERTLDLFRSVLSIPETHEIIFFQGGATLQFAAVPMNLLTGSGRADYVVTGNFAMNAYKEALLFGKQIRIAGTTKDEKYVRIPAQAELELDPDADYVHICQNNTVEGTKWQYIPDTGKTPLVSDMSSCILSEPVDLSRFGIVYAGAQKNIAPAGLTVVIARKDLLADPLPGTPTIINYKTMAEKGSMYNTPPCWPIYMAMLTLEWIEELGGLTAMKRHNEEKAALIYDYLDQSRLFKSDVLPQDRSLMNVVFKTGDEDLDGRFVKEAAEAGMTNLKGHRSVGGMRASIYNAMPRAGVERLVTLMADFEKQNGK